MGMPLRVQVETRLRAGCGVGGRASLCCCGAACQEEEKKCDYLPYRALGGMKGQPCLALGPCGGGGEALLCPLPFLGT